MKNLNEILKRKQHTYSFELFPPKTEAGYQKLLGTIKELCQLNPDFISCTYGAGGGNRGKTLDIVEHIQNTYDVAGVAHLTCVLSTKNEIKTILDDIKSRGIQNILALRGDTPQEHHDWRPGHDNFKYSSELCDFIRKEFGDYFGVGVAGFPEGHPDAPSKEKDREFLKLKIDKGADLVITQLFFDNSYYFEYVKNLKKIGVTKRIIPGILPITNYAGLIKFCDKCKTSIPQEVKDIFEPIQDNAEKTIKEGISFATKQCQELLKGGAPGIHFYSLNKIHPVDEILNNIRPKI